MSGTSTKEALGFQAERSWSAECRQCRLLRPFGIPGIPGIPGILGIS
jgi:hypothetical protein